MINEILEKSEDLIKRLEKISKFGSKYNVHPPQEGGKIVEELNILGDSIPEIQNPKNQDELIRSELKRRLIGEAISLDHFLSGEYYDFDTIVSMYCIPQTDITGLRNWLEKNRKRTLESIERLFLTSGVQNYELFLPMDIPSVRGLSERVAENEIQTYHTKLGNLIQKLTKAGEFLRDIHAVPTTDTKSYFSRLYNNTLALAIQAICYMSEDGSLHIRERGLITLYGHEGMGHALNQVITHSNNIPYFLTKDTALTAATEESVAQFYQRIIFEDLKSSPETQKELDIKHKFDEIYQDAKDISQLEEYQSKLFQYAITVLADKKLGEPKDPEVIKKKIELVSEVSIRPDFPRNFVEGNKDSFDSKGNLDAGVIGELRYCAQPVQRALDEFAKQGINYNGIGRSIIDLALLKGFWTPIGYVDNARLSAQEK